MKVVQVQDSLLPNESLIGYLGFGQCAIYRNVIVMRVKPVNFLLNSSLIVDALNRHKVMVVNVEKGTCYLVEGDVSCTPIEATLQWSKK